MKLSRALTLVAKGWFNRDASDPMATGKFMGSGLCYQVSLKLPMCGHGVISPAYFAVDTLIRASFEPGLKRYLSRGRGNTSQSPETVKAWESRGYFALFLVEWLKDNPKYDKDYK